jgi:DNA helicase MCM9
VNVLFKCPRIFLRLLDRAALSALDNIFRTRSSHSPIAHRLRRSFSGDFESTERFVHVRVDLTRLLCPGVSPMIAEIRTRHEGRLLLLLGTVIRVGNVQSHDANQLNECIECKQRFFVESEAADLPATCPSASVSFQHVNSSVSTCNCTTFCKVSSSRPNLCDFQELYIKESVGRTRYLTGASWLLPDLRTGRLDLVSREQKNSISGESERNQFSLKIIVENDLVDKCRPGDDVCLVVVIHSRWQRATSDQRASFVLVGHAKAVHILSKTNIISHNAEKESADFAKFWRRQASNLARLHGIHYERSLTARDIIVSSIVPQLFGLMSAKLVLLLALIGGVSRTGRTSQTSVRGESHMLVVGEAGSGKSQLLRYAAQIAPRAILATGSGTTTAGLTASFIKVDRETGWSLEGGALVLADGGLCCIDEFAAVSAVDSGVIHEAMEQQSVSFAKSGFALSLKTRCTIFGATRPRGIFFDPMESLKRNTGLSLSLISRFDSVIFLCDERCPKNDNSISTHIISRHLGAASVAVLGGSELYSDRNTARHKRSLTHRKRSSELGNVLAIEVTERFLNGSMRSTPLGYAISEGVLPDTSVWSMNRVRRYVDLVRSKAGPVLSPDAELLIRGYYQLRRFGLTTVSGRPTIRLLESLIRMTQAHARLLWMQEATSRDVVVAIDLLESALCKDSTELHPQPKQKRKCSVNDENAAQLETQLKQKILQFLAHDCN